MNSHLTHWGLEEIDSMPPERLRDALRRLWATYVAVNREKLSTGFLGASKGHDTEALQDTLHEWFANTAKPDDTPTL